MELKETVLIFNILHLLQQLQTISCPPFHLRPPFQKHHYILPTLGKGQLMGSLILEKLCHIVWGNIDSCDPSSHYNHGVNIPDGPKGYSWDNPR